MECRMLTRGTHRMENASVSEDLWKATLLDLPPELLCRIFSQLNNDALRNLRCVCKTLKEFVENTPWPDVDFLPHDSRGVSKKTTGRRLSI